MLFEDWKANAGSPQIQVGLLLFRISQATRKRSPRLGKLFSVPYRIYALVGLGIDMPTTTAVGPRIAIRHGQGLVIHNAAVIGPDVTVRQGVTIGAARAGGPAPRIGAGVQIGASAILLGGVTIGDGAQIGAGAVVITDVPPRAVAVGNPARLVGVATPSEERNKHA